MPSAVKRFYKRSQLISFFETAPSAYIFIIVSLEMLDMLHCQCGTHTLDTGVQGQIQDSGSGEGVRVTDKWVRDHFL